MSTRHIKLVCRIYILTIINYSLYSICISVSLGSDIQQDNHNFTLARVYIITFYLARKSPIRTFI